MTHAPSLDPTRPVFIVDALTPVPGKLAEVSTRYLADYAPPAVARGMTLTYRWTAPPVALGAAGLNVLTFVWAVDGVSGWWRARLSAVADPAVAAFWAELDPMLAHRSRRVQGELA